VSSSALERDAIGPGRLEAEQHVERLRELREPCEALTRCQLGLAEYERVESGAAGADTEEHPAAGDLVDGGDVLGERDRMPVVRGGDERAEPDAARDGGRRGESGHRCVPPFACEAAPREVIVGPRVVEAVLLGGTPPAGGLWPVVLREDDDAEAHAPSL
jgi:hypothetical protein